VQLLIGCGALAVDWDSCVVPGVFIFLPLEWFLPKHSEKVWPLIGAASLSRMH